MRWLWDLLAQSLRGGRRVLRAATPARAELPSAALGRRGEALVARHYRQQGYRVVAQRWRCPRGEVDLIVERRDRANARFEWIAVEVKTRTARRRDGRDDPIAETSPKQLERVEASLRYFASAHLSRKAKHVHSPLLRVDLASVIARTEWEFELRVCTGRPFAAPLRRRGTHWNPEAVRWKRR